MEFFTRLRQANRQRHNEFAVQDFSLSFRGNELAGETGEACNEIKKLERTKLGARGGKEGVEDLVEELADVIISTDLIAMDLGINLQEAVIKKFNKTSTKHGFKTRL